MLSNASTIGRQKQRFHTNFAEKEARHGQSQSQLTKPGKLGGERDSSLGALLARESVRRGMPIAFDQQSPSPESRVVYAKSRYADLEQRAVSQLRQDPRAKSKLKRALLPQLAQIEKRSVHNLLLPKGSDQKKGIRSV